MTIEQIKRWIKHPTRFILALITRFGKRLPDSVYLQFKFYEVFGRKLDLKNPKTFNEKLQWLKLNDRKPEYTTMVDKVEAKKWVAERIGEQYIIPTIGVWERAEDIEFDSLPDQFVLKTNHDSGAVIICKDKSKLDQKETKRRLSEALKRDFYYYGREWPYKNVKRRILAEKLLIPQNDLTEGNIPDYKFMCFDGKVQCSFVGSERNTPGGLKVTFFDRDWQKLPFTRHYPSSNVEIPRPKKYEKMIEVAEKLSYRIKFVRVDFYEIDGKIYFGEMTFYPGCGYEEFTPEEWDYKLGELIRL